jgi:predicted ATPase
VQRLSAALDELRQRGLVGLPFTAFLADLAEGLGRGGRAAEGLVGIKEALERSERNEERWCVAELLRIQGELFLLEGGPNAAGSAEMDFLQGIERARGQSVLSWELRCATSLARLWHQQGQRKRAHEFLAPVYERFSEGFETADLATARALLDWLA